MRISGWSSDVCSSDLGAFVLEAAEGGPFHRDRRRIVGIDLDQPAEPVRLVRLPVDVEAVVEAAPGIAMRGDAIPRVIARLGVAGEIVRLLPLYSRSEEHTSELQSLMRTSYAVFCLKKQKISKTK